ncbi:MAG: hypothetical protein ABIZ04_25815 [Opitutus sp.]
MPCHRHRRRWLTTGALATFTLAGDPGMDALAVESTAVHNAVTSTLPRYDPQVRENYLANRPLEPVPVSKPQESAGSASPTAPLVTLPRIVVRPGEKQSPAPRPSLPRTMVHPPVKEVPKDEFLTPEAEAARLVEKHLSRFDRFFLNRFTLFGGQSKESRARDAEAIEHAAVQLNAIADLMDVASSEPRDPAEEKKLRDLYLDTYVKRPK